MDRVRVATLIVANIDHLHFNHKPVREHSAAWGSRGQGFGHGKATLRGTRYGCCPVDWLELKAKLAGVI
jgi:hypothetical protein